MNRRLLSWVLSLAAALVVGAGVLAIWLRPREVDLVTVHRGDAVEATYGTGTVEALERADLKPLVSGSVVEVLVHEGQAVARDQVLARLHAPAAASEFQRARGELASVEARAGALGAELHSAKAELERTRQLVRSQTVSSADAEHATSRVSVLAAELSGLDAQRRALRNDITSRTSTSGSEVRSRDLEIRAPLEGIVLRRAIAVGDFVTPMRTTFVVGKPEALVVEANVDESDIARIGRDTAVSLTFRSTPGAVHAGRILEIPLDADRERQGYVVKVGIERPPAGLLSGMAAELNFVLSTRPAVLLVRASAVNQEGFALVIRNDRIIRTAVTVGLRGRQEVEIVRGLEEGDRVVAPYDDKLGVGTRVRARDNGEQPS